MKTIKQKLRQAFPQQFKRLEELRNNRLLRRRLRLVKQFVDRNGLEVQAGPFAGMRFIPEMVNGHALAQLVGSYEEELHDSIRRFRGYKTVVNIGSAFGYYSVGFARLFPECRVIAYEMDSMTREISRKLAVENQVEERISCHGECTLDLFRALDVELPALIFCDCEGGEFDILDLDAVPQLENMDIVVEIHCENNRDELDDFLSRFAQTHEIRLLQYGKRGLSFYKSIAMFSDRDRDLSTKEFRWRGLHWGVLTSKTFPTV